MTESAQGHKTAITARLWILTEGEDPTLGAGGCVKPSAQFDREPDTVLNIKVHLTITWNWMKMKISEFVGIATAVLRTCAALNTFIRKAKKKIPGSLNFSPRTWGSGEQNRPKTNQVAERNY